MNANLHFLSKFFRILIRIIKSGKRNQSGEPDFRVNTVKEGIREINNIFYL